MKQESKRSGVGIGVGLAAVALLALVFTSLAESPGDIFKIGDGQQPSVTTDDLGTAVVLWEAGDEESTVVRGVGLDSLGRPLGIEFGVSALSSSAAEDSAAQRNPAAVFLPDDEFFVAWEEFDGEDSSLRGRRFASIGKPLGIEFGRPLGIEFEIGAAAREIDPSVGSDDAGNIVVTWAAPPERLPRFPLLLNHVRRFDSLGRPLGIELEFGLSRSNATDVAVRPSGEFLVVWQNLSRKIRGRVFDSSGRPQGPSFRIDDSRGSRNNSSPSATVALDGDFTVVWERELRGSGQLIYARRVSATGKPLGIEFQVSSMPSSELSQPTLAADSLGNTLVTWRCLDSTNHQDGILARSIDLQGRPLGIEFMVSSTPSQVGSPEVSLGGQSSDFLVVWDGTEETESEATTSIFGRCLMLTP